MEPSPDLWVQYQRSQDANSCNVTTLPVNARSVLDQLELMRKKLDKEMLELCWLIEEIAPNARQTALIERACALRKELAEISFTD